MYQVINARRIKTEVGLVNVAKHNSREEIYNEDLTFRNPENAPDWLKNTLSDAEKRLQSNAEKATDVLSLRKEKMQNLARKPQKNASAAIEFVISASPDFSGNWQDFFDKSKDFLVKKYGDNVISCAVHADETTPHMHILFVPIIEKNGKKRYSSSQFLGQRDDLKNLHTQFYEEVGQFFGLERGEENSRAKHDTAREFSKKIKEVERKEEVLEQNKRILQTEKRIVDGKEKDISEREKNLTAREEEVSKSEKNLNARQENILEQEKKSVEKTKALETIFKDVNKIREEVRETIFSPKEKILPDFSADDLAGFNSVGGLEKTYGKSILIDWKKTAVQAIETVYKWCQEKVSKAEKKFNALKTKLINTETALFYEKQITEKQSRKIDELEKYDCRKMSSAELYQRAEQKQLQEQRKIRTRSSGFER